MVIRTIKKYKNRLMYDTATSKLITLKQLAEMLRENANIRIEDNESGQDITRLTILQMLLDLEKSGKGMLNLLPDIVASLINLPRLDLVNVLRELIQKNQQDKELGQAWARRLIHETSLASLIPLDKEKVIVDEIAGQLDKLYDTLLEALERSAHERGSLFERIFTTAQDTATKPTTEKE